MGEVGWEASSKNLVTWGDLMPGPWRYFNCPEAFNFFAIAFMIFCLVTTNYSTATI